MLPAPASLIAPITVAAALVVVALGCDGPEIELLNPSPGAQQVDGYTTVDARFRFSPLAPRLVIAHAWGTRVSGELTVKDGGRWISFLPDERLWFGEQYVAQLSWDGAEAPTFWNFTVGQEGLRTHGRASSDRSEDMDRTDRLHPCRPAERCFTPSSLSGWSAP
jgi:hypothetical protein